MTTATGMVAVVLTSLSLLALLAAARGRTTRTAPTDGAPAPNPSTPDETARFRRPAPGTVQHVTPSPEAAHPTPSRPEPAWPEPEPAEPERLQPERFHADRAQPTATGPEEYPESMTAVLEPDAEEYLAWLADYHWPCDEYLDLELRWRHELDPFGTPDPAETPQCPQCLLRLEDVWPCHQCGRLLHSSCGHGMRRREVEHPYRSHAAGFEAVIAEWICTGCTSVVGLDVGDDDLPR
ncbi:hypothetical protein [Actinomadura kijaniata]|uniref:hypothetical protein n=1 Tax=Actinomadura kijaniata TaxID=46161 RepID=UPI00083229D1|nr:hypothetical protein [Actinomadura kijaniata]